MSHFYLRSERVIVGQKIVSACVEIRDQLIIAIHPYQQTVSGNVIDLNDKVLMPGIVDTHVHINEPGRTEWEGFNTATQAAAAGGITTLVDMPLNCIPVTTTRAAFEEKLAAVKDKLWVDCGFWGGVVPNNIGELDDLLNAGVLGVKSFLIDSGIDEFPNVSEQDIRKALPILAKHDVPYLIHAELDCGKNTDMLIGNSYQGFLQSRPKSWENEAIQLMSKLATEAMQQGDKNRIHIVHLSSDEGLAIIEKAKKNGLKFSAETCPHYLTISAEDIPDGKTLFKCCPPIREESNRNRLWQAIKKGAIDFIVSDHSPCTPKLKLIDSGDIEKAWGGISALQFSLPLIWTEARKNNMDLLDISRLMSLETAKFAGIDSRKGSIEVGKQADFVVFDEQEEFVINTQMIKHRHKITPYEGRHVFGKVCQTFVRGKKVFDGYDFVGTPIGRPILKNDLTSKGMRDGQ
jgi:allantoinase